MKKIVLLAIFAVSFSACAVRHTPVQNINFDKVDFGEVRSYKKGKSCKRFLFGIPFLPFPAGQPSLINAVKNGGLKTVKVVEYENGYSFLFLTRKKCLIAYGHR